MAHLNSFRQGWQSEHLAKFILSKFSFVAEPSTICDDIGSDFFCTLFKIENKKFLLPQSSFSIQIKSEKNIKKEKNKINITNKIPYLCGLEIPFFIGVVDRVGLKLTIYSGEYLSNYFSLGQFKGDVFIKLVEERSDPVEMTDPKENCIIFPKVMEIKADYDYLLDIEKIKDLHILCRLVQENISSFISNEFIFKRFDSDWVDIYSGCGSAKTFRTNLLMRLAEVFCNLKWAYTANPLLKDSIKKEFEPYKNLYERLTELYNPLPNYLISVFDILDELLK